MLKRCMLSLGVLLLVSSVAAAAMISVDESDWTGSRSTPGANGLTGTGRWADGEGGMEVSWNITRDNDGFYHYVYSVFDRDGSGLSPQVSHFLLEISPTVRSLEGIIWNVTGRANAGSDPVDVTADVEGPQTWTGDPESPTQTSPGANNGNPNLPDDVYGISIPGEGGGAVFSIWAFISTKRPVWGDIYFKDGRHGSGSIVDTAWNSGFGSDPLSRIDDFLPWVPTPDTNGFTPPDGAVPEPATLGLLGLGLASLIAWRKRRRQARCLLPSRRPAR